MSASILDRVRNKVRRTLATSLSRRLVPVKLERPVVSFTFDDAPRSAFVQGASILSCYGARATYYVCFGLEGQRTEVGEIGTRQDFERALGEGHELGCHTFDHLDAWHVPRGEYLSSIDRNAAALATAFPGRTFATFAYPKSGATAGVKSGTSGRFIGCRGGGQDANIGGVDLNLIQACFLDRRTGIGMPAIQALLARTVEHGGWLVLATHDILPDPTPYGCTPQLLDDVARAARNLGAELLSVGEVCRRLSTGG